MSAEFPRKVPEVYETSDGKLHTSLEAAKEHEERDAWQHHLRAAILDVKPSFGSSHPYFYEDTFVRRLAIALRHHGFTRG